MRVKLLSVAAALTLLGDSTAYSQFQGFIYSDGIYATLSAPSAATTEPNGINDAGQMVGWYGDPAAHGYFYSNGTYNILMDPAATGTGQTLPTGINDAGQIVGTYFTNLGVTVAGFLYSNGIFTSLSGPQGSTYAHASGINNAGQIVGSYGTTGGGTEGFLLLILFLFQPTQTQLLYLAHPALTEHQECLVGRAEMQPQ
jgi:probable HAF family extracellular repeat protein